ncbi:MAG: GNAT family N-acetyltransferase [Clostridia bacterium]|nr:GNAT family N-acetyltransferase [Clostridia bacterium]
MLILKEANFEDTQKEYEFVREIPENENGFTNAYSGASFEAFRDVCLPEMIAWSEGKGLPDGFVPETFLFLWEDNEIVGQFRIRHHLCPSLIEGGGHIGYFIKKDMRNRGLGKKGLVLTLEKAWKMIPEDEIYLRVQKDNPASLRVMLSAGGYIHHEDDGHFYVRIRK